MDSAWKKLARYGYAIGDTIEDAAKGVIEGVTDAAEGVVEGVTGAASATIDAGESALKLFQDECGLLVTGKLDEATRNELKLPRCANADLDTSSRLVAAGGGLDRPARLVAKEKWQKKELTWRVTKLPSNGMPANLVDLAMMRAFAVWEKYADLKFVWQAEGCPDMEIRWEKGNHGCADVFDGSGGTLAHGFFPRGTKLSGDLHFDDEENWSLGCDTGVNLTQAACHEMGHALGLQHSRDSTALMAPTYRGYIPVDLAGDDIPKIQGLYGACPADKSCRIVEKETVWVAPVSKPRPDDAPAPGHPLIHYTADATRDGKKFIFTVLKCTNLPDTDSKFSVTGSENKTDAYVRVKVGDCEKKTNTIKDTLHPIFQKNNAFIFSGGPGTEVELLVKDWDPESKDDTVGLARIILTDEILDGSELATVLVVEKQEP